LKIKILLILIFLLFSVKTIFAANPGDILINEFSSNSDPEWVEIYNSTNLTISLNGWKLKDAAQSPKDISSLGEIPARSFKVFETGAGWLNNSGGDSVTLLDNNNVSINTISYGHSGDPISTPAAGKSAGRNPDGGSNWQIFDSPTKGGPNNSSPTSTSTPTPTQDSSNLKISLSEIYPAPNSGEKEWVEVYNPNNQAVDLSSWKFQDGAGTKKNLGGSIGAYSWVFFEYSSGWLNNGGDTLHLLDPNSGIIETVTFGETAKGIAWAKDASSVWQQTSTPTPGSANQITRPQGETADTTKSSKKTSSTTGKETTKQESKETAKSGSIAKTTTTGQVLSLTEATLPALLEATRSGGSPEVTNRAAIKSSNVNFLGAIFLILAGGILLGSAAFRFWKMRR
jgi:hypothetical protein